MVKRLIALCLFGLIATAGVGATPAMAAPHGGAAQAEASVMAFEQYCPYALRSQYTSVNIRSGPGTGYPVVDVWRQGQIKYIGEPPVRSGGWRMIWDGAWVTEKYIIRVSTGGCFPE